MTSISFLVYNIFIRLYYLYILVSSVTNSKARKWIRGRRGLFDEIDKKLQPNEKRIWIHCASVGEFEQARPIITKLKNEYDHKIILTFYSPSGYELRKDFNEADYVFYMPLDTKRNANRFIEMTKPELAVFVKYEFWIHFINQLKHFKIPAILVSAVFRKDQFFFKKLGGAFKLTLEKFTMLFVQNKSSLDILHNNGIMNAKVAYDTRFDRVSAIVNKIQKIEHIDKFKGNMKLLIAGSTWSKDEELLIEMINSNETQLKHIIAPHEIQEEHVSELNKAIKLPGILFSELDKLSDEHRTIIVDNIGLLSSLYSYGSISYVGGGFGSGIHNVLEPAAFGLPVIFGPNYKKFQEAKDLIDAGAAFCIKNKNELAKLVKTLCNDKKHYNKCSLAAKKYVENHVGGTTIIMEEMDRLLNDSTNPNLSS